MNFEDNRPSGRESESADAESARKKESAQEETKSGSTTALVEEALQVKIQKLKQINDDGCEL